MVLVLALASRRLHRTQVAAALIFLAAVFGPGGVRAATTGTWNVNRGGLWSNAGNWIGGVPAAAGDTANLTYNLTAPCIITNDASRSIGVLNLGDSGSGYFAYTLTNNSGATCTFNNNGAGASLVQSITTASDIIATPVALADNLSINNSSAAATLTISGIISGNQSIVKSGAGTLTLAGANTFTGLMTVTNGTVNVTGNEVAATGGWSMPINNAAATVNFQSGSTVVVNRGNYVQLGIFASAGALVQTLNVAGTVTNNGSLLVTRSGVLNLNRGGIWFQNGGLTNSPPPGSGYSAAINVNSGGAFTYSGTNPIVLSPSAGNGGEGLLTINGGTFTTGQGFTNSVSPPPAGTSGYAQLVLQNNGTLVLSANVPQLTSGFNTNSIPALSLGGGDGAINTAGYSTTITNAIGGVGNLTKLGAGTLTLGAANPAYSGTTTISNGTLALANSGSLTGSRTVLVAATNATLQLAQTGALMNSVSLVVNPGGVVVLNGGVNQTVGALCLGGQWESAGTWGSSASAASNTSDVYFSGAGLITVTPAIQQEQSLASAFVSSWDVRYYNGSYDNVNPAPGVIAYMPYPGWDYVPTSSVNLNSYEFQFDHGWPVAVYFIEQTAPVGDNTNLNGTYQRSNSVADTVTFLTTNTSPALPLNYVLSDFEPYDQTLAHCELEITNMLNLVRASPNTNVSAAFVGNYACYPGGTDSTMSASARIGTGSFYLSSGLNVAQPNAYPYSSYTNNGPNARSGLFWSDLELVSFAKLNLPAGHKLVPWVDNSLTGDPVGVPTVADCVALLAHVRLRGADGFSDLGGLVNLTYGWSDLDWLFHGTGNLQIFNLATSESSGLQWSGCGVGANAAFLFSNLGTNSGLVSLPNFSGLPASTPSLPAGTHTAWYFVSDPYAIATNQLVLGRNGINHGMFLNGNFTLPNAIQVVQNTDAIPAVIVIGTCVTNTFAPTFAGSLTLSNNVTLQSYGPNLTFAGAISGSGGVTNFGNATFTGINTYADATTVSAGALFVNGQLAGSGTVTVLTNSTLGGSGSVAGTVTVQAGGAIQGGDANDANTLTLAALNLGSAGTDTTHSQFTVAAHGKVVAASLNVSGTNLVQILDPSLTIGTNTLFTYGGGSIGGASGFSGFQLGTLPGGATGHLLNTGSAVQLGVTSLAMVNTNSPVLTNSLSGGTLILSWPVNQLGWRLLVQTNHLAAGISLNTNDWGTVAGSSTTNQVSLPVNAANLTDFYRLVYP